MDARTRLHAALRMIYAGRYEESLRELIWFFEHALEEDPAMHGVRLSFALGYWADLAQKYAPARAALDALRERGAERLLSRQGDRALFHDVASIDHALGQPARTHEVYVGLRTAAPELAAACTSLALPAVIAAGDFELAEQMLPDPEHLIRRQAAILVRDLQARRRWRFSKAPFVATSVHIYAEDVKRVLTVLEGRGRRREAQRLRQLSTDLIHATTIRRAVRAALLPGAHPPWQRAILRRRRRKPA
jgi:hypothetical protein